MRPEPMLSTGHTGSVSKGTASLAGTCKGHRVFKQCINKQILLKLCCEIAVIATRSMCISRSRSLGTDCQYHAWHAMVSNTNNGIMQVPSLHCFLHDVATLILSGNVMHKLKFIDCISTYLQVKINAANEPTKRCVDGCTGSP